MKNIDAQFLYRKKGLLRVDFNVPIDKNQNILEDRHIVRMLPTLRRLISDQAKIIITSHLGRPKGRDLSLSLKPVATRLTLLLNKNVLFSDDCISEKNNLIISGMSAREVLLLENLRFYKEKKVVLSLQKN